MREEKGIRCRGLAWTIVIMLLIGFYINNVRKESSVLAISMQRKGLALSETQIILIDVGHGGSDPGKVGVNQALEKDINLEIAVKLKNLLELNGFVVRMTREEDKDLATEGSRNRKAEDMKARIELMRQEKPLLAVSIHQNSYSLEACRGAQTFYYKGSIQGKRLAGAIQKHLITELKDENKRVEKENAEYYLLKNSPCPLTIVECGFLSNQEEAERLNNDEYQEKVAFAIHLGIIEYVNTLQEAEYE